VTAYVHRRFASLPQVYYDIRMNSSETYTEESARAFGIDPTTLEPLVGNSGADVFRGESRHGPKVLKILSPGNVKLCGGKQSVLESLQYQKGLAERMTGDVAFAGPLRSDRGVSGEEIESDDGLRIATAYELASGKEVEHRINGLQIPVNDPKVGGPLFERIGKAAGIMHRYSSEYPIWWSAADADRADTPFSGRTDRDGAGLMPGAYHWIDYVNTGLADVPELEEHWESVLSVLKSMTAKRDEYGYLHYDYSITNMLYDNERLTVIDHGTGFGQFVFDIGSGFSGLERFGVPKPLMQEYWSHFVASYNNEFSLKKEWCPWLRATLDFRRIVFYIMNIQRKESGGDSFDFPLLDRQRAEMLEGKPKVDIDFSLL
jgi:hypothetical protein